MKRRLLFVGAAASVATLALAAPALAQDGITAEAVQVTLDNIWILIAAVLVIFMQAGFALVEAGLTRAKSVANIMMKNLMDFSAGVLAFAFVGFAIAFGAGNELLRDRRAGSSTPTTSPRATSGRCRCRRSSSSRWRSPRRPPRSSRARWPSARSSRATSSTASSSRRSSTRSSCTGCGAAAGWPNSRRR